MKTSYNALLGMIVAVCPLASQAAEWSGAHTLGFGYNNLSGGGGNALSYTLDSAGEARFNPSFGIGYSVTLGKAHIDEFNASGTVFDFNLAPEFKLQSNNMTLGAYFEYGVVDADFLAQTVDGRAIGLTAGMDSGNWEILAFYGQSQPTGSAGAGIELDDFGLKLGFQPSDRVKLAGNYMHLSGEAGAAGDVDGSLFSMAGAFELSHQVDLFAGASFGDIEAPNFDGDFYTIGFGASYKIARKSGEPILASLEYAQTGLSDGAGEGIIDSVRFGLSIPIGNSSTTTPLNSVAGNVFNSGFSAASSAAQGLF